MIDKSQNWQTHRNRKKSLSKKFFYRDDRAALQTIGVTLLVTITVIIASITGTFYFDMRNNMQRTYIVAATASQVGDDIVVTYYGGPDDGEVDSVRIINAGTGAVPQYMNSVGESYKFSGAGTAGKDDRVTVVARFNDDTELVILDVNV